MVIMQFDGVYFNGFGDYILVVSVGFEYVSDVVFSVVFWMMKEQCMGGIYEYMYFYNVNLLVDIVDDLLFRM